MNNTKHPLIPVEGEFPLNATDLILEFPALNQTEQVAIGLLMYSKQNQKYVKVSMEEMIENSSVEVSQSVSSLLNKNNTATKTEKIFFGLTRENLVDNIYVLRDLGLVKVTKETVDNSKNKFYYVEPLPGLVKMIERL